MRVWVRRTVGKSRLGFYCDAYSVAEVIQKILRGQVTVWVANVPIISPLEDGKFMVAVDYIPGKDADESIIVLQELIAYSCAETGIDFAPLPGNE